MWGQPEPDLWDRWTAHDPSSTQVVDHSAWGTFLDRYLVTNTESGINLVRYADVTAEDHRALEDYIGQIASVNVDTLNRDEQYAYWLNMYNAITMDVILDHYPVSSIQRIRISPGLLTFGPWGAELVTVNGIALTLDDIEHRILRPIWQDPKIHYGVNCAAIGCPNLQPVPFTSANVHDRLEQAATEFIRHPRGLTVANGRLTLSSIYDWFDEDFESSVEGIIRHVTPYLADDVAEEIRSYTGRVRYRYDWSLIDAS